MSFREFFKQPIQEEFDQTQFVELAKKWLKKRFGDMFEFKHNPKLNVPGMKSYNVSIEGKEFIITGKAFDTSADGKVDTVLFKIEPVEE
jgi:hypothetical protein